MADQARKLNDSMQRYRVDPNASGQESRAPVREASRSMPALERRKPGRPWGGSKPRATRSAGGEAAAAAASPAPVNQPNDPVWKEF